MLTGSVWLDFSGLMQATLLAAFASAAVRGNSGVNDKPLLVFQKFYLDVSGAFLSVVLLQRGDLGWTPGLAMVGSPTAFSGNVGLALAIGLLLVGLLAARHRWSTARRGRLADGIATVAVLTAVVAFTGLRTSNGQTHAGMTRIATGMLDVYCSRPGQGETLSLADLQIAQMGELLLSDSGGTSTTVARRGGKRRQERLRRVAELQGTPTDLAPQPSGGISRAEVCAALKVYLSVRDSRG